MQGDKIQSAKTTLLLFLKSLPTGCLFNVVSFGSHFSLLFDQGSRIYKEKTLKIACNIQATMDADMGGTELLKPLQKIYSKPPTPGYSRQILLITDGEVWNVDQVLQLVGRHAHETRLFSIGVGHGASTALVRGAARAGRGRSEMVLEENLLQQKVMGLVGSMVQESVQEVTIACEVEPASRVALVPKVPPVIFGGQHLILYARVPATTQVKSVTVRGQLGTKPLLSTVEGQQVTTVHDEGKSLHRLAARAQLQQWHLDEEEDVAEDMVALSTASGVVCRRTALVGIDKESGKPIALSSPAEGMPEGTYDVKQALKFRSRSHKSSSFGSQSVSSHNASSAMHPQAPPMGVALIEKVKRAFIKPRILNKAEEVAGQPEVARQEWDEAMCHSCERRSMNCDVVEGSSSAPSEKELNSGLLGVVSLQQFDGSWTLEDAAKLTEMPLGALSASNPARGKAAWATALVLVLLERKFGEQREQWALLATKAQTFITGCGVQLEDLLAKARNTLHAK